MRTARRRQKSRPTTPRKQRRRLFDVETEDDDDREVVIGGEGPKEPGQMAQGLYIGLRRAARSALCRDVWAQSDEAARRALLAQAGAIPGSAMTGDYTRPYRERMAAIHADGE